MFKIVPEPFRRLEKVDERGGGGGGACHFFFYHGYRDRQDHLEYKKGGGEISMRVPRRAGISARPLIYGWGSMSPP